MVTLPEGQKAAAYEVPSVAPMSETVAAIAVIVLTILGLVDVIPGIMMSIATIVVGAAILLQGANTATEYAHALSDGAESTAGMGGGVTLEFLAGGAGIVLGILSLFTHAMALAPAALIVFGGVLLLAGSVGAGLSGRQAAAALQGDAALQLMARQASAAAAGGEALVGIAAIILGILALIPIHGEILTLVGLLAVGGGLFMTGVTSSSFLRMLRV